MKKFDELKKEYSEKLELYVPVVNRVHGKDHPEFNDVYDVYNKLSDKMKAEDSTLNEEFEQLREITDNYRVPEDTCESYEAVYDMLHKLDEAYNN